MNVIRKSHFKTHGTDGRTNPGGVQQNHFPVVLKGKEKEWSDGG